MSRVNYLLSSVVQQKALISANLNSTLLYQFLFGIYTGLFPATVYIYIHKENRTRARDMVIIGSTTALYFITALNGMMNWFYTDNLFRTHGSTRVEMFIESLSNDVPLGVAIIDYLTFFAGFSFADGLLVWRCFYACGRSFRIALLPIMLLTVETVLALTSTVYRCLINAKPNFGTIQIAEISDNLSAATSVIAAATSLVSTGLICRQIWRHTTLSSRSRKHYKTIIMALVESSALYTVAVLFSAILNFTNANGIESSLKIFIIINFVDAATQIISGMVPTLMVARLIVSSHQEDAKVSSLCLPSNLIDSPASHATGANKTNVADDLEMQQSRSIGVGEQESEEIQAVPRNEYCGRREDELERTV